MILDNWLKSGSRIKHLKQKRKTANKRRMTRINYHYSCNRWIRLTYSESHWLIDWKIIIGRYAYTRQLKWCNAVDRSLPYNYQLHTFKNSITYTGVHQLKRGTATCERHGSINNAKIGLGSSLQSELPKQWIWWRQFHWASSLALHPSRSNSLSSILTQPVQSIGLILAD